MNRKMINTQLFITCRLCLENTGVYQIIPEVQEQILFCFSINVNPFDGFPQLICSNCEKILNEFTETKRNFIDKQSQLKTKNNTSENEVTKIEPTINSSADKYETNENSSDDKNETTNNSSDDKNETNEEDNKLTDTSLWTKDYDKYFVCKLCPARFLSDELFSCHITDVHKNTLQIHSHILNRHCQVELPRVDVTPNITYSLKNIVHCKNIITQSTKLNYYITFLSKDKELRDTPNDENKIENTNPLNNLRTSRKRKRRIQSNSSNDTVIVDNTISNPKDSDQTSKSEDKLLEDWIDINDTDEDSKDFNVMSKNNISTNIFINSDTHENSINKIISLCESKHIRKQSGLLYKGSQLRRIILSVGRKNINQQGFNCSPFLKFLEYKNLDILWLVRPFENSDTNYIKINTRVYNDKEDPNVGWSSYSQSRSDMGLFFESQSQNVVIVSPNPITITELQDSAVLYNILHQDTSKLLNANPVANPKKLPKKTDKVINIAVVNNNENLCIPIITSTTSLAVPEIKDKDNGQLSDVPRIKVKPVAELMSDEMLKHMKEPHNLSQGVVSDRTTQYNNIPNHYLVCSDINNPNYASTTSTTHTVNSLSQYNLQTTEEKESMILNTIELPNVKTDSPYKYLQTLLKLHNIILLDTDANLPTNFKCLIKFKVRYEQETKEEPVILCLSLHNCGKQFCLKIKDRNQENINIIKATAYWQWEILKIFKGEVQNKLLANAKNYGQDSFDITKEFLHYLESIKHLTPITNTQY